MENSTLYQRLGGSDGIDAVVKIFYSKVYSDSRVKKWFEGVSQEGQMKKMARFVRFATGSGEEYGQTDLGRPHAKLVERGLQDRDYDVIVELFTEAMAVSGSDWIPWAGLNTNITYGNQQAFSVPNSCCPALSALGSTGNHYAVNVHQQTPFSFSLLFPQSLVFMCCLDMSRKNCSQECF